MKLMMLFGFLFLGGVIFTSAWFVNSGTWIIYPGILLIIVGLVGFSIIDYKD